MAVVKGFLDDTSDRSVPISGSCRFSIRKPPLTQFGNLRKLCATGHAWMYPTGKDCGRESTEHNTAAPDTWPRVRDCADAVRAAQRGAPGALLRIDCPRPTPRFVTRCVVADLAPQAMIGRVWVCAASIRTDKTQNCPTGTKFPENEKLDSSPHKDRVITIEPADFRRFPFFAFFVGAHAEPRAGTVSHELCG